MLTLTPKIPFPVTPFFWRSGCKKHQERIATFLQRVTMSIISLFTKPQLITIPLFSNSFIFHKKKYIITAPDGWYDVSILNNTATIVSPSCPPMDKTFSGYVYNNQFIPSNFDIAKRKYSLSPLTPIRFNSSSTLSSVSVIVWEDKSVYYAQENYSDVLIFDIRAAIENEKNVDTLKGVTPELRMLYLFHALEKENLKKALQESLEKEEKKRFLESVPGRLKTVFERAGAVMSDFSTVGNRIIVNWTIKGGEYIYNSVLDNKTFMVVEAGYCMSNDDRRHNITSLVKTAELYEEKDLTYITRR